MEFHIADILKEAGPNGLHIKEIGSKCNADLVKIGQVLRLLASAWIFQEVKPDVFANNRTSSILAKGLPVTQLLNSPETKYSKPESAMAALLCSVGDECIKGTSYMYEVLSDPSTALSGDGKDSALCRAFNTEETIWDFFDTPAQKDRRHRFGAAMKGVATFQPMEVTIKGFDWGSLKDGSIVVDVGGGIGTLSMAMAKKYPHLKLVVQDRGPVTKDGFERAKVEFPEGVESGRLSFQEHDFFTVNPVKNADVFMAKYVIHDWSNKYSLEILKRLREAAAPHTKLVLLDKIIPYMCPLSAIEESANKILVPGFLKPDVPEPIIQMSGTSHMSSVVVMLFCNGQERTMGSFIELCAGAGWKVVEVFMHDAFGQYISQILAVPV